MICAALSAGFARQALAQGGADDAEASRARVAAHDVVVAMESSSQQARLALRRARAVHDARAAACADEALTRADVSLRIGLDHEARASAAWAQGDRERARFEMSRLSARGQMAKGAARDAAACLAPAAPAVTAALAPNDVTVVRLLVDPALPRDVAGYP